MSLYGQYSKERLGRGIVETEEGFATFEFHGTELVYIVDLYVIPEKRKSGVASKLADEVVAQAKELGFSKLLGTVDLKARGANESIKVLLAYGMTISHSENNALYFLKDI